MAEDPFLTAAQQAVIAAQKLLTTIQRNISIQSTMKASGEALTARQVDTGLERDIVALADDVVTKATATRALLP